MKIAFEISDRDVRHYQDAMRRARHAVRDADDAEILQAARDLFGQVKSVRTPAFVSERMARLEAMVGMVEDEEWALSTVERERVLSALVYFCDPEDLIPDHVPGLGFLDDAIMVELAFRELRHEIEAYQDFCAYRSEYDEGFHLRRDPAVRTRRLMARRDRLRERAARRRQRDTESGATAAIL
jgi:hypothetical protein